MSQIKEDVLVEMIKGFQEDIVIKVTDAAERFGTSNLKCDILILPVIEDTKTILTRKEAFRKSYRSLKLRMTRNLRNINKMEELLDDINGQKLVERVSQKLKPLNPIKIDSLLNKIDLLESTIKENLVIISELSEEKKILSSSISKMTSERFNNKLSTDDEINRLVTKKLDLLKESLILKFGSKVVDDDKRENFMSMLKRSSLKCHPIINKLSINTGKWAEVRSNLEAIVPNLEEEVSQFDLKIGVDNVKELLGTLWFCVTLINSGLTTEARSVANAIIDNKNQTYYHNLSLLTQSFREGVMLSKFVS